MSSYEEDAIQPGDIVAVRHGTTGRQEGLVIGSHIDYAGRQIIEVQLDGNEIYNYNAWSPYVTRVKRVVTRPYAQGRTTTHIRRKILW